MADKAPEPNPRRRRARSPLNVPPVAAAGSWLSFDVEQEDPLAFVDVEGFIRVIPSATVLSRAVLQGFHSASPFRLNDLEIKKIAEAVKTQRHWYGEPPTAVGAVLGEGATYEHLVSGDGDDLGDAEAISIAAAGLLQFWSEQLGTPEQHRRRFQEALSGSLGEDN